MFSGAETRNFQKKSQACKRTRSSTSSSRISQENGFKNRGSGNIFLLLLETNTSMMAFFMVEKSHFSCFVRS